MNFDIRINRLSTILELLNKGYDLSTPNLVERFGVSKKIIQTDFKDYILPLFVDDKIYYDYSSKTYKAKNNFLTKTLFSGFRWKYLDTFESIKSWISIDSLFGL